MALEDEIKQTKPFASEYRKLVLNIQFTSSYLQAKFADSLKAFNLTPHQYNVLRILKGKYPETYRNSEIAERMIDKSSNATRIVDKLVKKDLVSRTISTSDRRQVDIMITPKGLDLLETIEQTPFSNSFNNQPFDQEKAKMMNDLLDEMRK